MSKKNTITTEGEPTSGGSEAAVTTATIVLQQRISELEAKVDEVEADNYKVRQDRRDLQARVRELEKSAPEEGGLVLNKEQAEQWQQYQQIGKPDALKAGQEKLTALERQAAIAHAAKHAAPGVAYNDLVLSQLVPESAVLAVKAVKDAEGNETQVATIKVGNEEKPLADYAAAHWEPFMPALVNVGSHGRGPQQPTPGTTFIKQQSQQPPPKPKEVTPEDIRAHKVASGRYGQI